MVLKVVLNRPSTFGNDTAVSGSYGSHGSYGLHGSHGSWIKDRILVLPQEIAEKASGIISQIKDVQTDTEDLFEHPLRELQGLDKQLKTIRGSLKAEVVKKVELEEHITKER